MGLIIDTSVLIEAERGKINFDKWSSYEEVFISSLTVTELLVGVDRAKTNKAKIKRSAFVDHILSVIGVVDFGYEEAKIYAHIIHNLFVNNITIGVHDMMIGATAIARGYPVITINIKDFNRIEGLEIIDIRE